MSDGVILTMLGLVVLAGIGLFMSAIVRGLRFGDAQAQAALARRAAGEQAVGQAGGVAPPSRSPAQDTARDPVRAAGLTESAAATAPAAASPAESAAESTAAPSTSSARRTIGKPMTIGERTLPLSAGVEANGFLFLSGQLGTDADFALAGDDIEAQTRQALENVKALLEEAGCTLADVVKVTAFVTDAPLSTGFNSVYAEYFADAPPARSTVVSGLLLPGAVVEIEAVAAVPG